MAVSDLKLVSWNVQGLNNKFELSLLFKSLASHKPHILFMQETHLMDHLMDNRILALDPG